MDLVNDIIETGTDERKEEELTVEQKKMKAEGLAQRCKGCGMCFGGGGCIYDFPAESESK